MKNFVPDQLIVTVVAALLFFSRIPSPIFEAHDLLFLFNKAQASDWKSTIPFHAYYHNQESTSSTLHYLLAQYTQNNNDIVIRRQ